MAVRAGSRYRVEPKKTGKGRPGPQPLDLRVKQAVSLQVRRVPGDTGRRHQHCLSHGFSTGRPSSKVLITYF